MKKIIIIIFTLIVKIYSQQPNIKAVDTLYISFKSDKFQVKSIYKGSSKSTYLFRQYHFYFKHKNENNFTLYHDEFSTINNDNIFVKSDIKCVNKKYLKKRKKAIIGIKYFKEFGVCDSLYIHSIKPKVIYIIDCDEKKKKQVTLYEVSGSTRSCWKED